MKVGGDSLRGAGMRNWGTYDQDVYMYEVAKGQISKKIFFKKVSSKLNMLGTRIILDFRFGNICRGGLAHM